MLCYMMVVCLVGRVMNILFLDPKATNDHAPGSRPQSTNVIKWMSLDPKIMKTEGFKPPIYGL